MQNLLTETIDALKEAGKTSTMVRWVGSRDGEYAISWKEFAKIADAEYYEGYGSQEIPYDLVVVGSGWWLERHEYDGSEWWEFKSTPKRQEPFLPFTKVIARHWKTLKETQTYVADPKWE